jgi:hypothetical protein
MQASGRSSALRTLRDMHTLRGTGRRVFEYLDAGLP